MRILVIGAAGMLGSKLVERLARDGGLGAERIDRLTLVDRVAAEPAGDPGFPVESRAADLTEPGVAAAIVADRPDVIFHLAAVVSGEAEEDLDKGYRVNLDATRMLLDAIRAGNEGYRPRVVFSSSIAVFGPPFPDVIGDDHGVTPATSYGTQKAMIELLLSDHSRRGLVDGIAIRLPTICVRPGRPNLAASGFFSGIIREPLNGQDAVLPVATDVRHWFASPRAAIGFLLHAATLDTTRLGDRRALTMPGVSATVADEIEALRRVAGDEAVRRVRHEPDETIMRIVAGWPREFDPRRARELGFSAEADFDEIVRVYVEDELGAELRPAPAPAPPSRGSRSA
jgi:D-erythronate 2-dehydrogenase